MTTKNSHRTGAEVGGESILIIEDHPLVADATRELMKKKNPMFRITICESAGEATIAAKSSTFWHRVFLDLDVPGARGLELPREFADLGYSSRSCVITAFDRPDFAEEVRALGMLGYIVKDLPLAGFSDALDRVLRGDKVFPDPTRERPPNTVRLTRRQQQLLQLLEEGRSSKEIALTLGITEGTVNNHIAGLLRALNATNRAQAVARGIELGFGGVFSRPQA